MEKKVLHLSVSKQWFDLISSGEKKEEYREIKDYWTIRLFDVSPFYTGVGPRLIILDGKRMTFKELVSSATSSTAIRVTNLNGEPLNKGVSINELLDSIRIYTHVLFINGYGDDKPRVEKEIESITIGKPRKGWCPDEFLDKNYFVIKFK